VPHTRTRGSRTPCPPPPGAPPPLQSRHRQALRVVLDGLRIVPLRLIRVAKVSVRPCLPRPVAHLLCNRQVLRVVPDGLGKVPQRLIRVAEGQPKPCQASKSAWRLPPPWPHTPALPRPASRQLQQALVSSTRASGQPSSSLPCGCRARSGRALALVPGLPRLDLAATERKGAGWGGRATVRHLRLLCIRGCLLSEHQRLLYHRV